MLNGLWRSFFALVFMSLCSAAFATGYQISRTQVHPLQSALTHKHYEIYVRTPSNYAPESHRYPVVVVNDAEWAFPIASGVGGLLMGNDMQEFILVGISYSQGDTDGVSRTRDYTPTFAPDETSYHSVAAKQVSGGAKQYLTFIETQVFPLIESRYSVDKTQRIFVGHSFGGLLGTYALITNPTLFSHYIIGSPSLWYDKRVMFQLEADYAKNHKQMDANVFMYVGDSESLHHPMQADMESFAEQLQTRHYRGLTLHTQVLQDATHHSAFSLLLTRALPHVLPKQDAP